MNCTAVRLCRISRLCVAAGRLQCRRMCSSTAVDIEKEAVRSNRAQRLFMRRARQRPQDGMEVWGVQNRKRALKADFDNSEAADKSYQQGSSSVKSPRDSMVSLVLPFGTDSELRDQYKNVWGQVRVGKLLEDIDALAGNIAYTHCDDADPTTPPLTLVTASVDRIDLVRAIPPDTDLRLRGCVTNVGRSSMNIDIDLTTCPEADAKRARLAAGPLGEDPEHAAEHEGGGFLSDILGEAGGSGSEAQPPPGPAVPQLLARTSFTFVARDRHNRSAEVPRLAPAVDGAPEAQEEERRWMAEGKERVGVRKQARARSLRVTTPTAGELELLHGLYMKYAHLAPASSVTSESGDQAQQQPRVFSDSTQLRSVQVTMPQDRNIHGKVFGGYLMRKAHELAWSAAYAYAGQQPFFVSMSDVSFHVPVEIGHLLHFSARVEHSLGAPHRTSTVSVSTTTHDPGAAGGPKRLSNVYHFTFRFDESPPRVVPRSYEDAMGWLAAHRLRQEGMAVMRGEAAVSGGSDEVDGVPVDGGAAKHLPRF